MSVAIPPVERLSAEAAAARVGELRALAQQLYRQQLLDHPFTHALRDGTLSRERLHADHEDALAVRNASASSSSARASMYQRQ